jgi:hypothetical protein
MSEHAPPGIAEFDPGAALRAFESHGVRYVVIGALAAIAHGAPLMTVDLDVTPARGRENLERIALALRDIDARLRTPHDEGGVAFPIDADMLGTSVAWTLLTSAGSLDLVFLPPGTSGYEDLARDARPGTIGGVRVPVASLPDVVRCKEASNREKDQAQLPILRRTLEEIRRLEREERQA